MFKMNGHAKTVRNIISIIASLILVMNVQRNLKAVRNVLMQKLALNVKVTKYQILMENVANQILSIASELSPTMGINVKNAMNSLALVTISLNV